MLQTQRCLQMVWGAPCPDIATRALDFLNLPSAEVRSTSVRAAQTAVTELLHFGFTPPAWSDLARGTLPAPSSQADSECEASTEFAHGWQFLAADAVERWTHERFLNQLNATGRALLRSQLGRHNGDIFGVIPTSVAHRPHPGRFLTSLRRRLWLPLAIATACCPGSSCARVLDPQGFHLLACPTSGRLRSRARPLETAWCQVLREAGARVRFQVEVGSLNVTAARVSDHRTIDFVATGLPLFGGLPICGDPTMRAPITMDGIPQPNAASDGDATLRVAEAAKRTRYHDLNDSQRCVLLPLACSTGGRWSEACIDLVSRLARNRVLSEPALLRVSYETAFRRRWWGYLSVALHEAVAASLDPGDVVTELAVPPADALDIWVQDPPPVSFFGPR